MATSRKRDHRIKHSFTRSTFTTAAFSFQLSFQSCYLLLPPFPASAYWNGNRFLDISRWFVCAILNIPFPISFTLEIRMPPTLPLQIHSHSNKTTCQTKISQTPNNSSTFLYKFENDLFVHAQSQSMCHFPPPRTGTCYLMNMMMVGLERWMYVHQFHLRNELLRMTAVTCEHFTCSASAKCEFAGRRMDIWISSSKIFRGREGEEQIPSPSHTPSTINCKTYTIWIMCGHILFSYMFNTFIITLLVDRMLPTSAQEVVYLLHYTDYSRMPLYIANIYELVALAYL